MTRSTLAIASALVLGFGGAAQAATLTGTVTVDGRAAAATVMAERLAAAPTEVTIEQRNLAFGPGTVTVAKGGTVKFPNFDNVFHSAYSKSAGNEFDLGLYAKGMNKQVVMKNVGTVEVKCRVHKQMKATIIVVDASASMPTAADGRYRMADLAPGHYRVIASLPDGSARQDFVTVSEAAPAQLNLAFETPAAPAAPTAAEPAAACCH